MGSGFTGDRFYPSGGRALIPGAGEPTLYISNGDAGCAETSREAFLSEHEGETIVVTSDGDEYDVGDSNPIFLGGSWTITDVACDPAA